MSRRLCAIAAIILACAFCAAGMPRVSGTPVARAPRYQTKTYVFKLPGADPTHAYYAAWAALADNIVTLPEDSVSFDELRESSPYDAIATQRFIRSFQSNADGSWPNSSSTSDSWSMFRIPFERYIPRDATVSEAFMCVRSAVSSATTGDVLWAVADTLPGDWPWWSGNKTGRANTPPLFGRRSAGYLNQRQNAHTAGSVVTEASGYCAACDSFQWSPTIASRTQSIDWGPRSLGLIVGGAIADSASLAIDIKRSVQFFVSGKRNNGIWLLLKSPYAGNDRQLSWTYAKSGDRYRQVPFWVVQWSEKEYAPPYPGNREVAFSFVSDDGLIDANDAWSEVFAEHGLRYTAAICQSFFSNANRAQWSDIHTWLGRGVEIASHSRRHMANGLAAWDSSAAETDSLIRDMDPSWLYSGLATISGDSAEYAARADVGKTLALPLNTYNERVVAIGDSLGYLALRTDIIGNTTNIRANAPGDTSGAKVAVSSVRLFGVGTPIKFNLILAPYAYTTQSIFGTPGGAKPSEAALRRTIRLRLEDQAASGINGWWVMYTHPLFSNAGAYGSGIDADQMEILLDEIEDRAWVSTLGDVSRFFRRNGTLYAHPTPWGTDDKWESRLGGDTGPDRKVWYKSRFAN